MNLLEQIHENYIFGRRTRVLCKNIIEYMPPDGTLLDVGCGDGSLAAKIMQLRPDVTIKGIDVLIRDHVHIPVELFDSINFPYNDASFDTVMFVDVLHHTQNPERLLQEAVRVARKSIIIKDHLLNGFLAGPTLRFMDYIGNARYGVNLVYNYWPREQWQQAFETIDIAIEKWCGELNIYPWPLGLIFDRSLHFIAGLSVPEKDNTYQ